MSKIIKKVGCGFGKWSIGIGENGEVIINLFREPIYGEISLYDISIKEMKEISKMFSNWAELIEAKENFNKKEKTND